MKKRGENKGRIEEENGEGEEGKQKGWKRGREGYEEEGVTERRRKRDQIEDR